MGERTNEHGLTGLVMVLVLGRRFYTAVLPKIKVISGIRLTVFSSYKSADKWYRSTWNDSMACSPLVWLAFGATSFGQSRSMKITQQ